MSESKNRPALAVVPGEIHTLPTLPASNIVGEICDKRAFAKHWGLSARTVDSFLSSGMPHCKIGARRVRIVVAEADAWMMKRFSTRRRGPAKAIAAA
jgi:hypothetical protein